MKTPIKIGFVLLVGVLFTLLLITFYQHQRSFSYTYKTVLAHIHQLQSNQDNLTYNLLRTSMHAYNNQDSISKDIKTIRTTFTALEREAIFNEENYRHIRLTIGQLDMALKESSDMTERFLMINAGVKNSYVFLSSMSQQAFELFGSEYNIFKSINTILVSLSNSKRMLDIGYIGQLSSQVEYLNAQTYTPEQRRFIDTFLTHITFITENSAEYFTVLGDLMLNKPRQLIVDIRAGFTEAAQADVRQLNRLALMLLCGLLGAMGLIIWLLLRSHAENRRLLSLKNDLEYSLQYDALTSLLNRLSFEKSLRTFEAPMLLLINIDHFKHINDFYGTTVGDMVLKEFASAIQLPVFAKYSPTYFRLGGDDFGILFEDLDRHAAIYCARTISATIASTPFKVDEFEILLSASIAINDESPILENADIALKHLKSNHIDNIISYSETLGLQEQLSNNIDVMHMLKTAIASENIIPYFQPIIHLGSGETEKFEALARLRREDGTIVAPGAFLEIAKQTVMYQEITLQMIRKTFEHFAELKYRFSINLSMRDLIDPAIISILRRELQRNPDIAKRLDIELLESESIHNPALIEPFLHELKSYGCQICIDDFGSGYSNFAYLTTLPIDILKIDGSLISRMRYDHDKLSTVKTIVWLAQQLDLQTVAEFIEDKETAEMLKALGVTYGQGYYFAKPAEKLEI